MPYTGHNDPKLPPRIKAMPIAARRKFVKVFNAFFKNCRSPKIGAAGSVVKCEGAAMKVANAVVKTKEVYMDQPDESVTPAPDDEPTEDGGKMAAAIEPYHEPVAFGGAISFDDVDKYRESQDFDYNISNQKWTFDKVFENIMAQDPTEVTMDQKLSQVKSAVDEFAARSENPPEHCKEAGGLVGQAVAAAKRLLGGDRDAAPERIGYAEFGDAGRFVVTRDKETGALRWTALVTNKFEDRDEETFSEASHQEFTEWADRTKAYSALRLVHVPGSEIGKEDFTAYTDGFVISSGTFDAGMEDVAASLAASKEALKISHGYHYNVKDLRDGVYGKYRRFEISIVPASTAANPWTEIEFTSAALRKEVLNMPLTDEKRAFLTQHLGEERTAKIEAGVEAMSKELEDSGVGFKELADALTGTKEETPTGEKPTDDSVADDDPADAPPATTEDADDDPGKDDPTVVTKELAPLAAAIGAAVAEAVKPIQAQVAEITGQVKELSKSDDEKVSDKMAPKTKAAAANGARPTDDKDNVIDGKEAAEKGATDGEPNRSPAEEAAGDYADMMTGADRIPSG